MILFPILTYATSGWMMGWASAPYDPEWSMRHPHRAGWMSLAGPAANFVLAILAAILIHIGIAVGVFSQPDSAGFTHMVQAAAPGATAGAPPLDGFGAVGLLMSEERARRFEGMARSMRGYSFIGLLIAWQVFGQLYDPLFGLSLHALYPLTSYSG